MGQPLPRTEFRTPSKRRALVLAAALLSALAFPASAALPDLDPGRPAMRTFVDKDGLPQNSVLDIAFDAKGYVWVATQAGAARYNGHEWTVVNMPRRNVSNYVRAILAASDGSMWFGTDGAGVACLHDGDWTSYDTASGLSGKRVTDLLETKADDGSPVVWVATQDGGISRFERGRWTTFDEASGLPNNRVLCLSEVTEDGARALWAGTGAGIARFERESWSAYGAPPGLEPSQVTCIFESPDGPAGRAIWVGTGRGLAKLQGGVWTALTKGTGLPDDQVQVLAETVGPSGARTLWIGTEGAGLVRLDPETNAAHTVPGLTVDVASLADVRVDGVSSTLWVGMNGGGLARMKLGRWTAFDTTTGLPENLVRSIAETVMPDGTSTMWIGMSSGGLARHEKGRWTIYDTSSGLPDNYVLSLLSTTEDDGAPALWVGTQRGGLVRFVHRGSRWEIRAAPPGFPNSSVRCLVESRAEDGSRVLWAALGGQGIARLERGAWTRLDVPAAGGGAPSNDVRVLVETTNRDGSKTLWAGTAGGGLGRFEGGLWTIYDTSSAGGASRGGAALANNSVRALLEVNDGTRRTLWVGTYGGVSLLDLDDPEARWTTLSDSTRPALPDNTVYQIRRDAAGRMYLFTNKGIMRLAPAPADPSGFSAYTFTTDDGLPSNECNAGASLVDSRGRIWAGTVGGAAVFDPALEIETAGPSPLYVERVRVGNDARPSIEGLTLAYDENNVTFDFALLSYFREGDTRFRSELAGFDGGPTEWSAERHRAFTNLPAGEYVFRVWARNASGAVSGPVAMSFRVAPAWWRTWWAYLLYAAAAAAAIVLGMRFRVRTLTRWGAELETTVAARTAELAEKARELSEAVVRLEASEKRALEAKEEAIEASRAKSVFLSNMSHELRTPLNAVIGFAQLMARDARLGPEQRQNLGIIHRSGEHLLDLINDVLSIAKIEAGRLTLANKPFDPRRLLQSVEGMMRLRAEEMGLELDFRVDGGFPASVLGDEGKLRQVLINLLGNAIKFTDRGSVTLRARWSAGRALFEVEDTGHGIAEHELGKLFAAFSQTESGKRAHEGSGLGLVISRQIARLMGGDLRLVRTALGRGTLFAFEANLPEIAHEASAPMRRVAGLAPGQAPHRILVVDDTEENRLLLVKLLRSVGFAVAEAANGLEAVEKWESWRPDLIWMDMRMPVMDGLEATRTIRSAEGRGGRRGSPATEERGRVDAVEMPEPIDMGTSLAPCKIVALTASAFEHERDAFLASGADDMVVKPFREETIFEKLSQHLAVRFVYDDASEAPRRAPAAWALTRERVRALPAGLLADLRLALLVGDPGAARDVVRRIEPVDAALAAEIAEEVRRYRFDEILAAIGSVEADPV